MHSFTRCCRLYYQMQQTFGHLTDSRLQYHEPEKFWKVFKLWGDLVNIREQQDAFDFFQALIDQIDEQLKVSQQPVRNFICHLIQIFMNLFL